MCLAEHDIPSGTRAATFQVAAVVSAVYQRGDQGGENRAPSRPGRPLETRPPSGVNPGSSGITGSGGTAQPITLKQN